MAGHPDGKKAALEMIDLFESVRARVSPHLYRL
jgi:hypothetical protein